MTRIKKEPFKVDLTFIAVETGLHGYEENVWAVVLYDEPKAIANDRPFILETFAGHKHGEDSAKEITKCVKHCLEGNITDILHQYIAYLSRALCPLCREDIPIPGGSGIWVHRRDNQWVTCKASELYQRRDTVGFDFIYD